MYSGFQLIDVPEVTDDGGRTRKRALCREYGTEQNDTDGDIPHSGDRVRRNKSCRSCPSREKYRHW